MYLAMICWLTSRSCVHTASAAPDGAITTPQVSGAVSGADSTRNGPTDPEADTRRPCIWLLFAQMNARSPVASTAAFGHDSQPVSGDNAWIGPILPVWDLIRVCTWRRAPQWGHP